MENTHIWTVQFIKENGRKIANMGSAEKPGKTGHLIMDRTRWERSMVKGNSSGLMDRSTKASFRTTTFKATELTSGRISVST